MSRFRSIVVVAAVYFASAEMARRLSVHTYASPVWPPSGIAIAALLLYGRRVLPGIVMGALATSVANLPDISAARLVAVAVLTLGNTLEALAGAWLAARFAGGVSAFDRAWGVFRFAAFAAAVSALIGAASGVFSVMLTGPAPASDAAAITLTRWIGHVMGTLVFVPFLVLWRRETRSRWSRRRVAEMAVAAAVVAALSITSFNNLTDARQAGLAFAFLCTPALLWPAFRLGLAETAATLVVLDSVAVRAWYRAISAGGVPTGYTALALQAYVAVTAVMLLAIAAEMAYGRRQHRELRLVTDDAPVYLAHCDRDGRYCFVNRAYAARFGLEPEQLIGRRIAEVAGADGYELFRPQVEAALAGERAEFEVEVPYERLGRRILRCSYVPERHANGEPAGFISASIDVTGQKRAEAQFRSEFALRQAIENSLLTGIAAVDTEGRQSYVNPAFCRMVGYSAEELIGKAAPFAYWPPDEFDRLQAVFHDALRSDCAASTYTVRLQHRSGKRFDVLLVGSSIRLADGAAAGWLASVADISEHQELHDRLKSQQELLRLVIDGMPGLVAYVGADCRYRFVNRAYAEWFGRSEEEIQGRSIAELVGPNWFETLRPHLESALAGETVSFERDSSYPDRDRTVRVTYVPDRAAGGEVRGIVVMVEDITAQALAARALRESEEKFRHIVETASEGIWIVDPQGVTTFANSRMCEMLGYSSEELLGRRCFDLIHPDDRPRGEAGFEARKRGDVRAREYRVFRKDGEMIWVHFSGAPLRDARGVLTGVLGMCTDLTARKYNEARYQTLFETTQDGVLILNDRAVCVDVNPAYCALLKRTREELIGKPFSPHVPPHRRAEAEGAFRTLVETGRYEGEFPLLAADGGAVELEWRSLGNFVPGLHCCMARDVRERKRFERQMQQTQKLESLGVMAGGVAHDFNNLLVGILANASLALESSRDESIRPMLEDVVTAGERAAGLVRQMLAYAGKARVQTASVDAAGLVRETATLVKASIPKTVALRLDLPADLPPVEADPAQLQQVIMNMVINGAEAIPADGPGVVTVAVSSRALTEEDRARSIIPVEINGREYVELRFTDSGSGIAPDVQRRIFDPFFTTKFAGRGLGLSAVLGIVRSHAGTLTLESAPGQGTTFRVLLPAGRRAAPQRETADAPAPSVAATGAVLVIDDEETVRAIARRALESRGHTVFTAEGGAEGIGLLEDHPEIVVVVLDLAMPAMTGDQVAPLLRSRRPEVPIILSSGYAESEAARRFADGEIAAFLQKPYTAAALAERVAGVIHGAGSIAICGTV